MRSISLRGGGSFAAGIGRPPRGAEPAVAVRRRQVRQPVDVEVEDVLGVAGVESLLVGAA